MNPNDKPMTCGCNCSCKHHTVAPAAIVIIGLAGLAAQLGYITSDVFGLTWPFLVVIIGLSQFCKCCGCKAV